MSLRFIKFNNNYKIGMFAELNASCTFKSINNNKAKFITISKGYYHCDRLTSPRHWQLNLPDMRRMTERWQNVGHSVWPALIGQAGEEKNLE